MGGTLLERYDDRMAGLLSCYDRVVITGTLPTVCYAAGMTRFLYANEIRVFDYARFAEPLRERVRERAASLAAEANVAIEHISKSHIRKEAVAAKVLERRGTHPGLVHVISAMESCDTYRPWRDKQTHKTYLRADGDKRLHYDFYFMDAELGLVYLRVPTWVPFRLQFYCHGHSWLAQQLTAEGIAFTMADNAFTRIGDWQRDKRGIVLRIETTSNDVSFFKHHRKVEHREGPATRERAPMKKAIYSLIDLREILLGCNRRYLAHLSALDDFSAGIRALERLTRPREVDGATVRGINFFDPTDKVLLEALRNPRVNITGIRRADLLVELGPVSPGWVSRRLRRLRQLGVVERVAGTYRYYLTKAGRAAIAAAEQITHAVIVPAMI